MTLFGNTVSADVIKARACWIGDAPNPRRVSLQEEAGTQRVTQSHEDRGRDQRVQEGPFPRSLPKMESPDNTLIFNFLPKTVREQVSVVLSHPTGRTLQGFPLKTNVIASKFSALRNSRMLTVKTADIYGELTMCQTVR